MEPPGLDVLLGWEVCRPRAHPALWLLVLLGRVWLCIPSARHTPSPHAPSPLAPSPHAPSPHTPSLPLGELRRPPAGTGHTPRCQPPGRLRQEGPAQRGGPKPLRETRHWGPSWGPVMVPAPRACLRTLPRSPECWPPAAPRRGVQHTARALAARASCWGRAAHCPDPRLSPVKCGFSRPRPRVPQKTRPRPGSLTPVRAVVLTQPPRPQARAGQPAGEAPGRLGGDWTEGPPAQDPAHPGAV